VLRIDASPLDCTIIALYFVTVIGIGLGARRLVKTDLDFFLSGRSLPAWITGLAFVAASLGALEILGMAANGAQYGSKVRSVPEWLRRRCNKPTHLFNAAQEEVKADEQPGLAQP
jgi:SSS family solute:Na+ symporter